ncbi:P-loop containing nucleoside triphosphate hydrolase protein [Coemansia reversa NRRL 1564]|uniref:P-loop containing nucleoside triphosphate hydrolase protein n=1 Tax=Coemansia reversa (strain ATCC 12441 / NRRL 1564) TaxID=763665 RepID=A0A2G5B8X9_COERN|nr:P-loop containing nucleoside triphosphate hydrolase protein [Coemansia reversa NRRL 1564]|eukprot:PIA15476.1 P-loop containing nucleoside triphosphate hydrolase protein [Coemansia reversa NRRL 1564]
MDDPNYDEFGNYIGPELATSSEEEESDVELEAASRPGAAFGEVAGSENDEEIGSEEDAEDTGRGPMAMARRVDISQTQIVLHEDKQYYPEAEEVFGPGVETIVQEEDTQPITEPIIAPIKVRKFQVDEDKDLPDTTYTKEFLVDLMGYPEMVRNIAVAGHLHHGKTALVDVLVASTHAWPEWDKASPIATPVTKIQRPNDKAFGYTDIHQLERQRGVSLKAMPISLVAQTTKGKSYALNILDTPGHVNFMDEVVASMRMADGVVLVVDAVEGVMASTERVIRAAIREGLSLTLVVNKVDRLIIELKLPPTDAYYKLKLTIEEVNNIIADCPLTNAALRVSPELGNVCFASATFGWCFSLESFARRYIDTWGMPVSPKELAKRLWGDIYYHTERRTFMRKRAKGGSEAKRSFVHFILEPLYKIFAQVVGEDEPQLRVVLESLGVELRKSDYALDARALLRKALSHFFGPPTGFLDMCSEHIKSPLENAVAKTEHLYTGQTDSATAAAMRNCDANGPLVVNIGKQYPSADGTQFYALGRIFSGSIKTGEKVRVLGEGYSPGDDEDMALATVTNAWIYCSRYKIPVSGLGAGGWVLLGGVDGSISKTATLTDTRVSEEELAIVRPLPLPSESVIKIAVEPVVPTDLPKMLSGLRKIGKSYPLAQTKVEESGEHIVMGTGELYLDCIMHDLRCMYAEIEIKVADPIVAFRETVSETSAVKVFGDSPNGKNRLTIISSPLEQGIAEDIEFNRVQSNWPARQMGQFFESNYGWDILAGRSIWAFGPGNDGPNILSDDTLPDETDKVRLRSVRDSIKQGFQWAAREGPLCDEPMRGTRFRILGADLAETVIHRGGGQIIPAARRVCYSSFLTAEPRLMEPINFVEIQAPADCVSAVYTVLGRRRGHVTHDAPKAGSPMYTIRALVPTIDSSGFETDLRTFTHGQAFCQQYFDHWQIVPGDPLDKEIVLRPLEPSSGQQLARDFMIKTRRRKGLSDDVSIDKYIDDITLREVVRDLHH